MAVHIEDPRMSFCSPRPVSTPHPTPVTLGSIPEALGTTIMAVEFDGGVIIGADSRTSAGTYIVNRVTDKLTKISDRIYCCRSGSAADTQFIASRVQMQLNFHSIGIGEKYPHVNTAATMFQGWCYDYRDYFSAGIIVAGWDPENGGQVYTIPLGGMKMRQKCAIGGSGSTFIYGLVDNKFKPGMTKDEAKAFVKLCVSHAMERDASSGGCIRMACITKDGVERTVILGNEIEKVHNE